MAHLESDIMVSGMVGSDCWRAIIMATSSPIWFDCCSPGTLIALFLGLFSPNHMPLPQAASSLPFLRQLLSVYTVIRAVSCPCSRLGFVNLYAGCCGSFGFPARIQKHSSSEFLVVIVGLNSIWSPFSIAAFWFFSDLLWVRVSPSFGGCKAMLYFSSVRPVMSRAVVAQQCGFLQFRLQSFLQGEHLQLSVGSWLLLTLFSLLQALTRSRMRVALWLVRRHSVFVLWYSCGGTPIWNHAGICCFRLLESFLGAKVRLNFFAVWSSVVSGRGVCFPFCRGRPNGCRVVRKVCMSFGFVIPSMFMQFIIASIVKVQVGWLRDLSVYDFSHVSSIAWFLASRSRRLIPPFVLGFVRLLRLIPGGVLFQIGRAHV